MSKSIQNQYKIDYSFEIRKKLADRILTNYKERRPVIVQSIGKNQVKVNKNKYLVPSDITVGRFIIELRKNLALGSHEAIFLLCETNGNYIMLKTSMLISELYETYVDQDGFLYLALQKESTFGNY